MRPRAFTLIELLVVISITALLMAVLLPALGRVRQQARATACRANIHQLLISLHQYDSEHHSLPYGFDKLRPGTPPGGFVGSMAYEVPGWWWFHYAGIVRNRSREALKAVQCPSKRLDDPALNKDPLCGNYGVNRALCKSSWALKPYSESFVGTPLSLGDLRNPGSTLLVVDSGYGLTCWWLATAEPPSALGKAGMEDTAYIPGLKINTSITVRPGQTADAIGGRHPNKTVNIGFADGHADLQPAGGLLVEKVKDDQYTNTRLWQGW